MATMGGVEVEVAAVGVGVGVGKLETGGGARGLRCFKILVGEPS